MIQRIQSLYLLLAAAAGTATWFLNLWKATLSNNTVSYFNAQSSYLVFVVYMIIVLLALICIFLYKNRKLQFRLTVVNILLAVAAIALQYFKVQDHANKLVASGVNIVSATYLPGAFLPVLILIFLYLAARGIYKDEKLIKSLDRLR
jgi:glucan phosphoethanolaminetransferase (alkaline phosphatase superfamily)